jgi:medium-chain acyl-[acyl-carrier-protein] hydrolase
LDMNKHVNNVLYFQWALDTLPQDILNHFLVREFDIIFRNECLIGEKIISQVGEHTENEGNEDLKNKLFIHRIVKEADQKEVIQAQTKWENLPILY